MFTRSLRQFTRPLQSHARRLASSQGAAAGAAGIARTLQSNRARMLSVAVAGAAAFCAMSGDAAAKPAEAAAAEQLRTLYPPVEPYKTGRLRVSDIHELYYEER